MRQVSQIKRWQKQSWLRTTILLLLGIYLLIGAFPVARFETDSMAIANACEQIRHTGVFAENVMGHSYHMQSGTYFIIITVSKIFNLSAFVSYSIITVVFALIFFFAASYFVSKISGYSIITIAIVLTLFQEMAALAYYPNSAVIAAAFFMTAFSIVLSTKLNPWKLALSGILLGLGAWCRIDVMFAFPSLFFLLLMRNKKFWLSLGQSASIGILCILVLSILMFAMHANLAGILGYKSDFSLKLYAMKNNLGLADIQLIRAHLGVFPALILLLMILGIAYLVRKKSWYILSLWLSSLVFYYLLGINNMVAPKHLSYYIPFHMLLVMAGIDLFRKMKNPGKKIFTSVFVFLFVFQYVIGLRVSLAGFPYMERKYSTLCPEPTLLRLGTFKTGYSPAPSLSLVFGTGIKIATSDEFLASSGILYHPLMWHDQKKIFSESYRTLVNSLVYSEKDSIDILVTDGSTQFVVNTLLSNGFLLVSSDSLMLKDEYSINFKRNNKSVTVTRKIFSKDIKQFEEQLKTMPVHDYLAVFIWDWQKYYMHEKLQGIEPLAACIFKVHLQ